MKTSNGSRIGWLFGVAVLVLAMTAGVARAGFTCTWTGSWDRLPAFTDDVIVVASGTNMTWSNSLPYTVASWTQLPGYVGTVTVQTCYSGQGTFTNFTITGDCVISNGVWTHTANPAGNTATYRLGVTVGGSFTLASAAQISVDARGFQQGSGPGGVGANDNRGPSHGGQGAYLRSGTPEPTYGSAFQPATLGSGGSTGGGGGTGGGAVQLTVGGAAQLDGSILARGGTSNTRPAAGGSIFITAGTVGGVGTLDVRSQDVNGWVGGGGGRIAVVLTNGTTFGSLTMRANGGTGSLVAPVGICHGAAGTIYRQTMGQASGQGTLIIDNNGFPFLMYAAPSPPKH